MSNSSKFPPNLDSSLQYGHLLAHPEPGDEIVISGLAGIYPESDNVYSFRDNLFNKVNTATCDNRRWDIYMPELPKYSGKIPDIEMFDAGFFGLHHRQADVMDPTLRLSLMKAFEAILDAGMNIEEIRQNKTGVFMANCFGESIEWLYVNPKVEALFGACKSNFAQRISYWLQVNGPSFILDTACSSGHYAIEHALKSIQEGLCENALVFGTNTVMQPFLSLQFSLLGILSLDGKCKSFDEDGDGYVRSEITCALLLQKAKNARRVYARVVHAKSNCDGYKEQGILHPSGKMQYVLVDEFYKECQINPTEVSYVEAHGTGTKVGDPQELQSIERVFCNNRKTPLLLGSVKSNIGHCEPGSWHAAVSKVIIGMETGYIPPNINFNKPRKDIEGLNNGKMVVVTEKTKWEGGYVAINCFGFGGANGHTLLKSNPNIKKNSGIPNDNLPRLVCVSGRTKQAIDSIVDDLGSRPLDAEFVGLLQHAFKYDIDGHNYRGYAVMTKYKSIKSKHVFYEGVPKPIWFIFSGLGSQWSGMGSSLMKISMFAKTIEKCNNILSSRHINIKNILTNSNPVIFEDNVNTTVGITAVQLALIDLLRAIEVESEHIIGYSIGEIACAYADNTLTLDQAILCSYYIGLASRDSQTDAEMTRNLRKLIPNPKTRSAKWLTTMDNPEIARTCSAEYLVHSLSCSFALQKAIPKEAVVIEVAPHGHLQRMLKTAFGEDVVTMSLIQKHYQDNIQVLVSAIGELYLAGLNPRIDKLYPEVEYPVSCGTPMISPLIKWNCKPWPVLRYKDGFQLTRMRIFTVKLSMDDFLAGHMIDGRILYPATGYLVLVWKTFAQNHSLTWLRLSVIFEDVKFLRATHIPKESPIYLLVTIQQCSGKFEVTEGDQTVVKGKIRSVNEETLYKESCKIHHPNPQKKHKDTKTLTTKDVYKELRLRGLNYSGIFRGIKSCNTSGTIGELEWNNNYISFMDTMLQMQFLLEDSRDLCIPTSIQKIIIDSDKHNTVIKDFGEDGGTIPVYSHKNFPIIVSGGIEIRGVNANVIGKRKNLGEPVLESYKFIPNLLKDLTLEESMRIIVNIAFENVHNIKFRTIEILDEYSSEVHPLLSTIVQSVLSDLPLIQADINILTTKPIEIVSGINVSDRKLSLELNCLFVIATNIISRTPVLQTALKALSKGGFIISRESTNFNAKNTDISNFEIIVEHRLDNEKIYLLRQRDDVKLTSAVNISNGTVDLNWLPKLQETVKIDTSVVVYSENDRISGILGLINCIRVEPGLENVKCVFVMDENAPKFDLKNEFYAKQLRKGLAVNVFKSGTWGTYRHMLLPKQSYVEVEHAYVNTTIRGDLSSLKWLEGPLTSDSIADTNKVLIYVYYAALNFRDIMTATGRLAAAVVAKGRIAQECVLGFEVSGRLKDGTRVMGIAQDRSISTMIEAEQVLLWKVPECWSIEDAATVPVVYGTVFYAFELTARMKRGQSILIHAGSGGIGQAAINVALFYGCTVYTTVGTQEKRDFIKAKWPQIKDNQIGNSRDTSFEQMIMIETQGRGVDMVLNSLAEEKLQASVRCLAKGGKFLEIGKFDLANDNPLPLSLFRKEASYHGVMLDSLFTASASQKMVIHKALNTGLKNGCIKPLARCVFKEDQVEEAFRFMAAGKHMGKVLIKIREEESEKVKIPSRRLVTAMPRHISSPKACYIIAGGLGGFGLELTDWMILRGARKVVLTSRNEITTGYQAYRAKIWRSYGVQVHISTADITTFEGCRSLIEEAQELGPIEGIFNLAVLLKDALLENQTVENYEISFGPKAVATQYLDELTREMCPELKMFVIFSSVSCGRGNAGQTNYGMANSVMERICERRKEAGFPALAVEWGAVGDVGLVADMQDIHIDIEIGGTLQQRISSCLSVLDQFLKQSDPIVSSMVVAEKRETGGAGGNIIEAVANILGIREIKTVSLQSSLAELGMDSIMAVEIKQTLEREFEIFLTPQDLRLLSFGRLQEIASEKENVPVSIENAEITKVGMQLLLRTLGNETIANEPVLMLPSLAAPDCNEKVFMVPGIEGIASVLEPLAKNIDVHCICLQLGYTNSYENIPDMAQKLSEYMLEHLKTDNDFTIVGYSYGALITLEIVCLLEAKGKIGHVVIVDGSPSQLKGMVSEHVEVNDRKSLQNSLLATILNLYISGSALTVMRQAIEKCSTWEEKLNTLIDNAPKNVTLSKKYQYATCEAIYKRVKSVIDYDPKINKLKSKVRLIKPHLPSHPGAEDLGLSEFFEGPIDIITVTGNHVTMLENKDCADVVNKIVREKNRI